MTNGLRNHPSERKGCVRGFVLGMAIVSPVALIIALIGKAIFL